MHRTHRVKECRRALLLALLVAAPCSLPGCAPPRGTIGAVLGQRGDGRLFVREVPKGLAADRAGLLPGDEILLIDGRDVRTLRDVEVDRALGGEVGTVVNLTVIRGDSVLRVSLRRTQATRLTRPPP